MCSNNPLVSSCKQDVPAGCVGLRECHDARGPPPRLPMRPCQGAGERQGQQQERELRVDSYTPCRARYVVRREREFRTSMEYMFSGPACCLIKVSSSEIEIFEHKVGCKSFSTDPHHGRDCLLLTPPHECGPLPLLAGQRPGSRDGRGWLPHFPQSLEGTSRLLQAEAAWSVFSRGCHLKRMRY